MCVCALPIASFSHVSVMHMAKTGGSDWLLSRVVWIKGNFHLLSPPAAGEMLLPFSTSRLESDSGEARSVLVGLLSYEETAVGEFAALGTLDVSEVWMLVVSFASAPSLFPVSLTGTPPVSLTCGRKSPPSCFPGIALKNCLVDQLHSWLVGLSWGSVP